jgi:formamidopyrimidine-DNA glycosylase
VHRVAQAHRRALVGKKFKASSPNGRFVDGARAIDDKALARVEAIGKNLFYFFDRGEGGRGGGSERHGHHVMHVHFGMSGRFSVHAASDPPAATPTTRLKLEGHGRVAMLSAMVVDLMDESGFEAKRVALGQDPLREDACADTLWEKFTASRKSVGLALMDQSMFAGVGNIYRAEILFKAGVHPEQPCRDLDRGAFDSLWRHSVELLQRGYSTGSILTVDPEEALVLGEPWTRRYVYNQSSCGRCGGKVLTWEMANRTVYCCGGSCQKLIESGSSGAFYTLVPIRPRRRGGRRSLWTLPGISLRPPLAFNPRPRRLSTPTDAFQLHPDIRSYGTALSRESIIRSRSEEEGRGEEGRSRARAVRVALRAGQRRDRGVGSVQDDRKGTERDPRGGERLREGRRLGFGEKAGARRRRRRAPPRGEEGGGIRNVNRRAVDADEEHQHQDARQGGGREDLRVAADADAGDARCVLYTGPHTTALAW